MTFKFINYSIWITNSIILGYLLFPIIFKKKKVNKKIKKLTNSDTIKSPLQTIDIKNPTTQLSHINETRPSENIINFSPELDSSYNFEETKSSYLFDHLGAKQASLIKKDKLLSRKQDLQNIDQLFLSFTNFSKKRLIVFQKSKTKSVPRFFVLSDLIDFYVKNICLNTFENIDLLTEFPNFNSFYAPSLITWLNHIKANFKYDEIYFILESEEFELWTKSSFETKVRADPRISL
jgi:hypothetical protein